MGTETICWAHACTCACTHRHENSGLGGTMDRWKTTLLPSSVSVLSGCGSWIGCPPVLCPLSLSCPKLLAPCWPPASLLFVRRPELWTVFDRLDLMAASGPADLDLLETSGKAAELPAASTSLLGWNQFKPLQVQVRSPCWFLCSSPPTENKRKSLCSW